MTEIECAKWLYFQKQEIHWVQIQSSHGQEHREGPLRADPSAWRCVYQIVVEEERPRRAKKTTEILKCYPVPIHFQNASLLNSQYYFAAEFPANSLQSAQPFTIGDNKTYNGYWNTPLLPHKSYRIYFQAASRANGETKIDCVQVATKAAIIVTQLTTPHIRIAPAAGDDQLTVPLEKLQKQADILEVCTLAAVISPARAVTEAVSTPPATAGLITKLILRRLFALALSPAFPSPAASQHQGSAQVSLPREASLDRGPRSPWPGGPLATGQPITLPLLEVPS
ncbi:hypothetical protein J1605_015235 [Eschrichtius robustus]|uniref:Receptor-type tyrosine-protein phosphatase U-like Fn3 domain-containing protein n=1 Tax=Eschrichtius robustus TaxID=9764 RepID=A0AB34GCS1_ESCRO|nr:hypothetical protein J1605_015235 [Eschrichtius robustus]